MVLPPCRRDFDFRIISPVSYRQLNICRNQCKAFSLDCHPPTFWSSRKIMILSENFLFTTFLFKAKNLGNKTTDPAMPPSFRREHKENKYNSLVGCKFSVKQLCTICLQFLSLSPSRLIFLLLLFHGILFFNLFPFGSHRLFSKFSWVIFRGFLIYSVDYLMYFSFVFYNIRKSRSNYFFGYSLSL